MRTRVHPRLHSKDNDKDDDDDDSDDRIVQNVFKEGVRIIIIIMMESIEG